MARVKSLAPANFAPQVNDTETRLNILFDCLNNQELIKEDTIEQLSLIAENIRDRELDEAQQAFATVVSEKADNEGREWMVSVLLLSNNITILIELQVGVKRLIAMSRATPINPE